MKMNPLLRIAVGIPVGIFIIVMVSVLIYQPFRRNDYPIKNYGVKSQLYGEKHQMFVIIICKAHIELTLLRSKYSEHLFEERLKTLLVHGPI